MVNLFLLCRNMYGKIPHSRQWLLECWCLLIWSPLWQSKYRCFIVHCFDRRVITAYHTYQPAIPVGVSARLRDWCPIDGNQWWPHAIIGLISVVYWWLTLDDWLLLYLWLAKYLCFQQKQTRGGYSQWDWHIVTWGSCLQTAPSLHTKTLQRQD